MIKPCILSTGSGSEETIMSERNLTQNLVLRGTKEQSVLPIRERDWLKIKHMIERVITGSTFFLYSASLVFGVFVAVIIGLVLHAYMGGGPLAVSPGGALTFVLSCMIGIAVALYILRFQDMSHVSGARRQILAEMDLVQQDYTHVNVETNIADESSDAEGEEVEESVTETFLK
jgi:hypothetical protein